MRIIHCGDIHLDSKMESNLTRDKAVLRKNEIAGTFQRMVEFAAANEVQAILICGDLFDTKTVSAKTRNILLGLMNQYSEIDFLYLRGNHDEIQLFGEDAPKNLKVFSDKWVGYEYEDENVVIWGYEFHQRNEVHQGYEVNQGKEVYKGYEGLDPSERLFLEENKINIVLMHGQAGNYVSKDQTFHINLTKFQNKHIDYMALGHIHEFVSDKLDERGVFVYSGCLEGRGFDETGEHGFVLLDIQEGQLDFEFVPFAKRNFHVMDTDITECDTTYEVERLLEEKIKGIDKDDLVRIVLTGTVLVDTEIDLAYLNMKFEERFFYLKILNQTKLAIHFEDYEHDISLKGEFIRMVLRSELDEDERQEVILYGLKALSGEEIH